jgi:hypothetical protein
MRAARKRASRGEISEIDKGVPIPTDWNSRYPLDRMDVGDSFTIAQSLGSSLRQVLHKFKQRSPDIAFVRRPEGQRIRIWRIK